MGPIARKTIPTSRRAAIWRAHDRCCIYCAEPLTFADLDVDHIVPYYLKSQPRELEMLFCEYGLSIDFDIDGPLNLVPAHRRCNQQKRGLKLSKNRALHFLSLAEAKLRQVQNIEIEIKEQTRKSKPAVLLQVAVEEGLVTREELRSVLESHGNLRDTFEVLTALPFGDSELAGSLSAIDVDTLYDHPILPRKYGLDRLTMAGQTLGSPRKDVRTCREWVEAVRDGYYAVSTYDIKEEALFKNVYSLVVALAQAKTPEKSYISDLKASIANFDLLPVDLLPTIDPDRYEELQHFKATGIRISDLINQGRVKIISSSPLSLTLHYDYMGLHLYEILRADLNNDGIEDVLIGDYAWAIGGTLGAGSPVVLTRLGADQPFSEAENIALNVTLP